MIEDDDLAENVKTGYEAAGLLDNHIFKSAMLASKAKLVNEFIDSSPDDSKARESAYLQLRAMTAFFDELAEKIQTGKIAERTLDERSKLN